MTTQLKTHEKVTVNQQVISSSNSKVPKQLQKHAFQPGQSGNPKGRPKSLLTKRQRLELLAEYAKLNPEKANPIEAIREYNKMDGAYGPDELEGAARFFEFLRTLRGYNPQQLPEAKKPEVIEGDGECSP